MIKPRTFRLALTVLVLFNTLSGGNLWAHDSGTSFADWMNSLVQPLYPASSCCGPADQFYVREYERSDKEGIAFTAIVVGRPGRPDFPVEITRETVIWDRVNPTGRGVVFILGLNVVCFVPGIGL